MRRADDRLGHRVRQTGAVLQLEAVLKCRFAHEGCYAPPVHMIKPTDTREITPYLWIPPAEEQFFNLAESERKQARAKQDWTGNGHNEETERSEFITHGTRPRSRMLVTVSSIARIYSNRTTVTLHSQKIFLPTSDFEQD
jgi:hypothetical protein